MFWEPPTQTAMDDTSTQMIKLIGLQNVLFSNTLQKIDISFGMLGDSDGRLEKEPTWRQEAIGTEVRN